MPVVCVLAGYARVTLMGPIRTRHEDRSASADMPNPGVVPEKNKTPNRPLLAQHQRRVARSGLAMGNL